MQLFEFGYYFRFGRRGVLVIAVILQLVAGVLAAFSPWFWMFVFLRFLTAVATGGTMVVRYKIEFYFINSFKPNIANYILALSWLWK